MFYSEISDIKTEMQALGVFDASRVFVGKEFQVGAAQEALCIIKLGAGFFPDSNRAEGTIHIMAQLYSATNIEALVNSSLDGAARALRILDLRKPYELQLQSFTADTDVFSPFGVEIPLVPPFGAWRMDVLIRKVY